MNIKILKQIFSKNNSEIQLIEVEVEQQSSVGLLSRQQKTILVIGVVHGEEPQGKFLIENYLGISPPPQPPTSRGEGANVAPQHEDKAFSLSENDCIHIPPRPLGEREEFQCEEQAFEIRVMGKNRLLFIPCLNPDGMAVNKRQNANGIDLNRNFPTKNWANVDKTSDYYGGEAPASEIETKFVMQIIEEYSPDVILTIHAPYKVVNYDGPAQKIAEKISEIIGYPATSDIGYPTPGSFGNFAGIERNIPTITLELDEEIEVEQFIQPLNKIFDYLANID